MLTVNRTVSTYDGYDECWSEDGRLRIRYYGEHKHAVSFDGTLHVSPKDEAIGTYLLSAAVFADAWEQCLARGYPCDLVYEFLPEEREGLYPAELLRLLLDDGGMELSDAVRVIVKAFGKNARAMPHEYLFSVQPRTAHLELVLNEALRGLAFHDPYDEAYRSPVGAVKEGTPVTLRVCSFGASDAVCVIHGDEYSAELPMLREGDGFVCTFTPESPAALWYDFVLTGAECISPEEGFRMTVYKRDFAVPEGFCGRVMYQIFPDRFGFEGTETAKRGIEYHKSLGQTPELHGSISEPVRRQARDFEKDYYPDDFYGGTLRGIAKKLPYLKGLGVGIVYLNPIVEARSNHRYDTSDYTRPDPILGSSEDYVNLCREAEKLGIAVINDGVFSHTGDDSIYFDRFGHYGGKGAYAGPASEFFDWYDFRHYPDDYRCWWNFASLPEVNELCESWQDHIIRGNDGIVRRWLRLGASGWRLDVADELPDEVLALIRRAAKAEKPDCLIIGEVWEDAVIKESYGKRRDYALGYSLDSVMNYPFRTAVISFALGKTDAFSLRDFLLEQKYNYPAPMYSVLMNLLGSHDVERLHTVLALGDALKGLDRAAQAQLRLSDAQNERATKLQKLCAAIQYSVPGLPCLYYGDEECLDGARDPFNRAPFEPTGGGLHNYYAKLAEIRNGESTMRLGTLGVRALSPDVIMLTRALDGGKSCCVVNRSDEVFPLPFAGAVPLLNGFADALPALSAEIYKLT